MHDETLKEIVGELATLLPGRFLGRIFQLSRNALAIDFGLKHAGYLFISLEPAMPRLYLIRRRVKELEKGSGPLSQFAQAVRAKLSGGKAVSITKDNDERVVRLSFAVADELGNVRKFGLIAQLTGRSANLFLLNEEGVITQALRNPRGEGQQVGGQYVAPSPQARTIAEERRITLDNFPSVSAAADAHYRASEIDNEFNNLAANLSGALRKEIRKRTRLKANLKKDLEAHGDPEAHKRLGDLLLANIANAKRDGRKVTLQDYYVEDAPPIEIEIDENRSLQDEAAASFSRFTKGKRAVEEIGARLVQLDRELVELEERQVKLAGSITTRDFETLASFDKPKDRAAPTTKKQKASPSLPGMRRYRSSDGYEVIVGRTARDNDALTFRVARPNDLWLHAGDYPGSHVIIRNSSRNEIPHRTIIEAAQLAAKFSQASKDSKVTIHYTQRKFLSKPRGAAPGLVRMSSFKSITVEPGENLKRD
jgi:predicted ribosome quality control (RQC) complex YloA/Tae2 family protein